MKITLTPEESENIFHTALCNALHYVESSYGLSLEYDVIAYKKASKKLESPCHEDVLIQILKDGNTLTLVDWEDNFYNSKITLSDVHERVQMSPTKMILEMLNETDDADTGDCIIQSVFFKEVIFG